MHCYFIVSEQFKGNYDGHTSGCNTLQVCTTNSGQLVVSANALNEFTELFADRVRVSTVFLEATDFPQPEFPY